MEDNGATASSRCRLDWVRRLYITQVVALLTLVQLTGLYWFSEGFLLARVATNLVSTKNDPIPHAGGSRDSQPEALETLPSTPPFSKVLVIIVDALRLDFLAAQQYSPQDAVYIESMTKTLEYLASAVCTPSMWCRLDYCSPCVMCPRAGVTCA